MYNSMKDAFAAATKAMLRTGMKVKPFAKAVTVSRHSTDTASVHWMRLAVKGYKEVSILILRVEENGLAAIYTTYLERGNSGLDMQLDTSNGPTTKELKRFATG